jgi:hypothetical protein
MYRQNIKTESRPTRVIYFVDPNFAGPLRSPQLSKETPNTMKNTLILKLAIICGCLVAAAASVNAQATRTWVSGVGDDVNPCSRTAPCKTFAGAISKTAEGGEIDALDPAGYGTVTIVKAMTIDGGTGSGWASILATGTPNGINVNTTTGTHTNDAVVLLRNITINGTNQAPAAGGVLTNGINHIKGSQLIVEHCFFEHLLGTGITQNSMATASTLRVSDCNFDNVATAMLVTTTVSPSIAHVERCLFNGAVNGINTTSNAFVTVHNCYFAQHSGSNGAMRANTGCTINASSSVFANNANAARVAGGTIRVSNNDFFDNTTAIVGTAESANNNRFRGNGTDGNTANIIVVK